MTTVRGYVAGHSGRAERVLVVNESGAVPASQGGAELLFDVIRIAYERTRVIVTTKLPFEQ